MFLGCPCSLCTVHGTHIKHISWENFPLNFLPEKLTCRKHKTGRKREFLHTSVIYMKHLQCVALYEKWEYPFQWTCNIQKNARANDCIFMHVCLSAHVKLIPSHIDNNLAWKETPENLSLSRSIMMIIIISLSIFFQTYKCSAVQWMHFIQFKNPPWISHHIKHDDGDARVCMFVSYARRFLCGCSTIIINKLESWEASIVYTHMPWYTRIPLHRL